MAPSGYGKIEAFQQSCDMSLTIDSHSQDYYAVIAAKGKRIDLSHIDNAGVDEITSYLHNAAEHLVEKLKKGMKRENIPQAIAHFDLGLARCGYRMKGKIFGSFSDFLSVDGENQNNPPVAAIMSDVFILPWEWLYDLNITNESENDIYSTLKPFWGMNRVVIRKPLPEPESVIDPPVSGYMGNFTNKPTVHLIIDPKLKFAQLERDFLLELHNKNRIVLKELLVSESYTEKDLIPIVNHFISDSAADIIHFACHSRVDRKTYLKSSLSVGRKANGKPLRYQLANMDDKPQVRIRSPLIFFNACSTGIRDTQQTSDFVRSFRSKGAGNIIAVESVVDSRVAMALAKSFYENLLSGNDIGRSLYHAKRSAILKGTESNDVVALFYSFYATASYPIHQ